MGRNGKKVWPICVPETWEFRSPKVTQILSLDPDPNIKGSVHFTLDQIDSNFNRTIHIQIQKLSYFKGSDPETCDIEIV